MVRTEIKIDYVKNWIKRCDLHKASFIYERFLSAVVQLKVNKQDLKFN